MTTTGPDIAPRPAFVLGPATRLLWRSPDSIHLEMGARAVVVDGLPPRAVEGLLRGLPAADAGDGDGDAAIERGATAALVELADDGFVWPAALPSAEPAPGAYDNRLVPPAPRLAGELNSLAARHGDRAAALLAGRRRVAVTIHGASRAATHLAALLAAAGVGRVHCAESGSVRLPHVTPGGALPADEGRPIAHAADDAVRRTAPGTDTTPLAGGEPPDLTVLAADGPVDEDHRAALHAAGAAHLVISLGVDGGVVGPLVVPGLTSCLRCADLYRRDRDPAWSALAVQLAVPRRYGPTSDVAAATVVVGTAAVQTLAFLDGGEPACIEGSLELQLPDWRLRRRSRPAHPECCGTPAGG